MNYWFTSDTHFGHSNILEYQKHTRPFTSIEDHDRAIISNWQAKVAPDDVVYHLGDFGFDNEARLDSVLSQLPGQKFFIWGNHDKVIRNSEKLRNHFQGLAEYKEITIEKQRVVLFHYPVFEWNRMHHGSYHFHGHTHGSVVLDGRVQDVGVDTRPNNDCSLWSWRELHQMMQKREVRPHHGQTLVSLRDKADQKKYEEWLQTRAR